MSALIARLRKAAAGIDATRPAIDSRYAKEMAPHLNELESIASELGGESLGEGDGDAVAELKKSLDQATLANSVLSRENDELHASVKAAEEAQQSLVKEKAALESKLKAKDAPAADKKEGTKAGK